MSSATNRSSSPTSDRPAKNPAGIQRELADFFPANLPLSGYYDYALAKLKNGNNEKMKE